MKMIKNVATMCLLLAMMGFLTGFNSPSTRIYETNESVGVTEQEVLNYLQGAPHYHWACCAEEIPGTNNWIANIENCGTATVYVSNGRIISHHDNNVHCPN